MKHTGNLWSDGGKDISISEAITIISEAMVIGLPGWIVLILIGMAISKLGELFI